MYRQPYITGTFAPYSSDTGCDIAMPVGSPIIALDSGWVQYAEGWAGCGNPHTPWVRNDANPRDTPGALLLLLDHPFTNAGKVYRFAWYCHLSAGFKCILDGSSAAVRVRAGQMIGHSGTGRSIDHLHFGLLTERSQVPGTYMPPFSVQSWLQHNTSPHAA